MDKSSELKSNHNRGERLYEKDNDSQKNAY